ncbi:MAG TPA: 6-phosphofructokinase [Candidatus Avimonoglobus intestinipullorum]|uniref:ATP-dependent 6-phosphofructokinase n=1 Tax=Candidatus Avimonoglobus intestinipullorum TaxID=2840699 RepID=A0A9D1S6F0_9FIRM|nr:6-phosphofructokinase [Candidatus Avimonoglobus intestinipullorum]
MHTIGVLTSGGDAPGMNAAIRAVVRTGAYHGIRVMGIKRGYNGLINGDMDDMDARSVSETLQKGGTILQTARCLEFKEEAGVRKGVEIAKVFGLDGLIVIGGDGSFRGALDLCRAGLPTVAVPGTIDNDIGCSEYTIGYDTCLNTVQDAVDKLRDTSTSHERCSVIEVMGRGAGYIALNAGIACGAEVVLVPEIPYDFDEDVLRPILEGKARGKKHSIIIVAEGVGVSVIEMAKEIQEKTGIEARATILGHVQRGGSPSVRDRVIASEMGSKAVELLMEGKSNRIVCMQNSKVVDVDIEEGLQMKKKLSEDIMKLAKKLSV